MCIRDSYLNIGNFPIGFVIWCKSYLSNRLQRIKIGNLRGKWQPVPCGVPQGSVLGPYLFASFLGQLQFPSTNHEEIFKYADDITLIEKIEKTDLSDEMEHNTNKIVSWIKRNGLKENEKKRNRLLILKKTPLSSSLRSSTTHCLRILGVTWESNLGWNAHVNEVMRKASSRMYAVRLLLPLLGRDKTMTIYNSIVTGVISYAGPLLVGMNSSTISKIERIRRRHHKLICGEQCQCEDFQRIDDILVNSATKLFMLAASNQNHPLHSRIPQRMPTGRFRQPQASSSRRLKSFVPLTCDLVNREMKR